MTPFKHFAAALVLVCACATKAFASPIEVRDDTGAVITLASPARRIVSLSPAATETLFTIGAGAQVVGTSAYSDWPEAARQVPRIGDAFMLNREVVVALRPDLAIVWGSGTAPQRVAELRRLGVPVYVTEARRFADIASTVERFGVLTGHDDEARRVAIEFRERLHALRVAYASRKPLTVFLQISATPLMTVNGRHVFSEALSVCGATNAFETLEAYAPQIAREAVMAADPDVIVALTSNDAEAFRAWISLSHLRATRHRAYVAIAPALFSRASPTMLDGVRELCERLDAIRARLNEQ
ncbi:MAG TPA: cobalamin-binding protein [Burkholderiaceae bacterium]|nr:cobalamin-binding protein [Burkholderiaceae bacterium]